MVGEADGELARAAAAKDPAALRTVIDRLTRRLLRIAWGLTRDPHEIEDLCQEGLAKATSPDVLRAYRQEAPLDAYLSRVATRAMVSALRSKGKTWLNTSTAETLPEPRHHHHDDVPLAELDGDVRAAIDRLPLRARLVLVLIAVEDLSYQMVADQLDMELGTVKSTYSRARKALRAGLEQRQGNLSGSSARPTGDD